MKKIVYFWIILLFSFCLAVGQTRGKATVRKPIVVSQFAEAEKAWVLFWNNFREAVRIRNSKSLYNLMAEDFRFDCAYNGGIGYQGEGVGRSFEIKKFDRIPGSDFDCGGWDQLLGMNKLSVLLKKGAASPWFIEKTPSRVIGEYWNSKTNSPCSRDGRENWAVFEYREKQWVFSKLSFCEGE